MSYSDTESDSENKPPGIQKRKKRKGCKASRQNNRKESSDSDDIEDHPKRKYVRKKIKPEIKKSIYSSDTDDLLCWREKRLHWKFDKKAHTHYHAWEGFIIFSQFYFKATKDYRKQGGWNFDSIHSWNPYAAGIKQVSMYLQILKCQQNFSEEEVASSLDKILCYLPDFRGKVMPKLQVEEDRIEIRILLNLINKYKPIGSHYNLKRYNDDIWTYFVIYYAEIVKRDPFLAKPQHVKDFIIKLFKLKLEVVSAEAFNYPSFLLDSYLDFYCGNVVNICKNLGFYLKLEYEEESLLESKPIKDLLHISHSLDERLHQPCGQYGKIDLDLLRGLMPKYWYVTYKAESHSKDFWKHGLVRRILMDVKNKVLTEGQAAWELGVTVDMLACAVQRMKPDTDFLSLTINQYVDQGFGSEENFWNEVSTEMLLEDLRNRVIDIDSVAFQLGTSSAVVVKKAGRIKTAFEVEEEKHKMRLEKLKEKEANAPRKLKPLELQIQLAEKNEGQLSDYEKIRLKNMKERLSLLNSLDIESDKNILKVLNPVRPSLLYVIEPRQKSSRIKTYMEKKKSSKAEYTLDAEMERQSPLWVGQRTPKETMDPVDHDERICWEIVTKFGEQLSQDELASRIPVPKLTMTANELIASHLDYYYSSRFLHRLESEIEICGSDEKLRKEIDISNWIHVGGGKGSDTEIISMAISEELIAFGDMAGGLGFWLGEKSLLLRPHNMPVCRTLFIGSGLNTRVVTASHDGTIRVFDASKQEFELAYSWHKRYRYKQGVVWLEPVDDYLWLVSCEEGDVLNFDRRDRKVNKIVALPNSRRSCREKIMGPERCYNGSTKMVKTWNYGSMEIVATPALVGSNIAIHPVDKNLVSLCDGQAVLVYDRRNCQKPISTVATSATFDKTAWNSTLSHHCGSSWSNSGNHFATYERGQRDTLQGSINLYSHAHLTNNDFVAKKLSKYYPVFSTGHGIVWSPWQEDVCYHIAYANTNQTKTKIIGVDVGSGSIVGELCLSTRASNMMEFHPTRPQLVVANLNETGDIVIYKEQPG